MKKPSYWLADSTWQTARVYIRSFDGKELLADGVVTIRPGDSLGFVARQYAIRNDIKDVTTIRLEVIERFPDMRAKHSDDPTVPPMFISWDEFAERLRQAGWTQAQIEKHIQEIQEDNESGE